MLAKEMFEEGNPSAGVIPIGQGLGLSNDIPTVKELIDRIMKEAEGIISKLTNV